MASSVFLYPAWIKSHISSKSFWQCAHLSEFLPGSMPPMCVWAMWVSSTPVYSLGTQRYCHSNWLQVWSLPTLLGSSWQWGCPSDPQILEECEYMKWVVWCTNGGVKSTHYHGPWTMALRNIYCTLLPVDLLLKLVTWFHCIGKWWKLLPPTDILISTGWPVIDQNWWQNALPLPWPVPGHLYQILEFV